MLRLGTDSGEYHILSNAARAVRDHEGISIEIGLREGGGSQYMIEQYFEGTLKSKTHVAVDPYGGIPYEWKEGKIAKWSYDNRMRNDALIGLFTLTKKTNVNFLFFNLTDDQYFDAFNDGLPVFNNGEARKQHWYSIAHLDAVHSVEAITNQVDFFAPRMKPGAIIVIDDVTEYYDIGAVEANLTTNHFEVLEKGTKKASYIRKE